MKTLSTLVVVFAVCGASTSTFAEGCLKGAAVGGVAGHFAGKHAVLGAAAGCAIGHHEASKKQKAAKLAAASAPSAN
ncbi:hypothetical protein P9250_32415 [Caballeronia sp. LP006]|uniref:hypothetical protein n=1 Tax=Caballeronia sp. LP006 TaxID=3038552 RepID=UPI002855054E|nr:hypothetical protein [Caballeronia sp. LP006]MDR5832556.1 hypothetical protein [Caballeronia sp. LP006]